MHLRRFTFAIVVSLCLSTVASLAQAQQTIAGYVTRVRGEAMIAPEAKQLLKIGSALFLGNRIATGADARLEARMKDGSVLTLSERTEFLIEQVNGSTAEAKSSNYALLKGAFRAITGTPDQGQPGPWQVRTPVAIIGVRGTELWGGLNLLDSGADTLDVVMFEGKGVYVENTKGITDLDKAGQGTTVRGEAAAPIGVVPWGEKKLNAAIQSVAW